MGKEILPHLILHSDTQIVTPADADVVADRLNDVNGEHHRKDDAHAPVIPCRDGNAEQIPGKQGKEN